MLDALLRRLVPAEVVDALCEVDVGFVEDGSPLERCLQVLKNSRQCERRSGKGERQMGRGLTPCNRWQVVQWQNFASSGTSLLN